MKSKQQHRASSQQSLPRWRRFCCWLWPALLFFWETVIGGIIVGTIINVITSVGTPLSSLFIVHFVLTFPLVILSGFGFLVLVTLLCWVGSRQENTHQQPVDFSERNRAHMLRRLHLRYEQMLSQSLQGAVQIELGLTSRPDAVQNTASLSLRLPDQTEQLLPPHTSIAAAYDLAQQELLILGEPGSGKSTLLQELAHHLVGQARADATQPLPIILPLSSWATKRPVFQEWIAEQIALLYDVPRRLSQQWIQAGVVLPLLDGLDEMEEAARPDCVAAINKYHREHLHPLVICSRTAEHHRATVQERLALHTAVVVQPLLIEQVDAHLERLGKPLAGLRAALHKNTVLQDLATTPLLLQVLILTYHGTPVRTLSKKEDQLRQQIWVDYVQRMVNRKGAVKRNPLDITSKRLSWLAQQMHTHNQTIFFLEELQPDWLPTKESVFYHRSVRLIFGLLFGANFALFNGMLYGLNDALIFGLLCGLLFGASPSEIRPVETLSWSWKAIPLGVAALLLGLYNSLLYELRGMQLTERSALAPNEGIRRSVKYGMFVGLFSGLSIWLSIMLGFGAAIGPSVEHVGRPVGGVAFGLAFGMIFTFTFGLRAALQHYILRCLLRQSGVFPLRAVPFLEDATARILLRRVGGGYSFSHRLLMDYFADSDTTAPPASTTELSSPTSNH